jgi:Tfp pilus assembly protein PilF
MKMKIKYTYVIFVFLIVTSCAAFGRIATNDFINFDDNVYVTENSYVQSGISLEGIRWAFSSKYFNLWLPFTWLSLMLDYQLYGLNAGGYHVTNLILHILSTLLLFWLFGRMTGAVWKSAFVAALFALHPLHVESVAWVSERKDVLSAFFWMLTLCLYVFYTEKQDVKRYLLVLFSFILALLSKPMVVTLPIIMILLDYWPLGRFDSKKENLFLWQLKEKLPFFVLSAVIVFVTLYNPDNSSSKIAPLGFRLANAPVAFMTYLTKTFWPHDMAVFYPFQIQIPIWQAFGAFFLILIITAFVIIIAKRLPYLFVGWSWFAITIIPVIGIIQISAYSMADRYHYLPSIGISIILSWGISSLIKNEDKRGKILFPASIACLSIMSVLSWQQCGYWKNDFELFSHALQVTNNNYMAHAHVGHALFKKGKIEKAIYHYNKAIGIRPSYEDAYSLRGIAYDKIGQYQQAINDFNEVITLNPDYIKAYDNKAVIYDKLGQYQKVIENLNETIRIKPDDPVAYYNRGFAYTKLGKYQSAINDFNKAIDQKLDYANAFNNRGMIYFIQNNNKMGCQDARKACELANCNALEWAKSKGICR